MEKDSGVSPVIGESLMIVLVLILVPIVTISLMNQLPEDRVPTVTIKMDVNVNSDHDSFNITLYHKGGDYLKKADLTVNIRVKDPGGSLHELGSYRKNDLIFDPLDYQVFDLSHSVKTPEIDQKIEPGSMIYVSMISRNSVVYPGEYNYEG